MNEKGTELSGVTLEVIPSGAALGAEVRGVDLAKPADDALKDALNSVWAEHSVLLFRDQKLNDDQLLSAARLFGTPQPVGFRLLAKNPNQRDVKYPEIIAVSNRDQEGTEEMDNAGLGDVEVQWHSDNSYIEAPPKASVLYSLVIPETGGDTGFCDQYAAYETLPDDVKKKIDGVRAKHDASRNSGGLLRPGFKLPETEDDVPGPFHPIVRTHPVTKRKALYLGRRRDYPSQFIEGWSEKESVEMLNYLWDHATQDQFVWMHQWRAGDLVIWDNRCAMHRRDATDPKLPRILHRTQLSGEIPE
ncbi:MAG: TauD/TfdA family dioxygenase [Rhodospirillaceae bacterium]|jgi:taurine dioxygenase